MSSTQLRGNVEAILGERQPGSGAHAGEVRKLLSEWVFQAYRIDTIADEAPAVSVVEATLDLAGKASAACTIRLIYETPEGDVSTRALSGAAWRLIKAQVDSAARPHI